MYYCLEGIPQHAWYKDLANSIFGDDVVIHHVEEETRRKLDHRAYSCFTFSKDPSKIPQMVFLTLTEWEPNVISTQIHFVRPREAVKGHTFKILIHLDVVEDLMFYHYPREELVVDGKIPWCEFSWQYGQPDGEGDIEEYQSPTRFCTPDDEHRWHRRDDDEGDRDRNKCKAHGFI
jgi:hypothetical protein